MCMITKPLVISTIWPAWMNFNQDIRISNVSTSKSLWYLQLHNYRAYQYLHCFFSQRDNISCSCYFTSGAVRLPIRRYTKVYSTTSLRVLVRTLQVLCYCVNVAFIKHKDGINSQRKRTTPSPSVIRTLYLSWSGLYKDNDALYIQAMMKQCPRSECANTKRFYYKTNQVL